MTRTMNSIRVVFIAAVLLFSFLDQKSTTATAQTPQFSHCRSTLFRLIGSTEVYLWVCRCVRRSDSRFVALGRATYPVPPSQVRSLRSHQAFVRCQNHQRRRLEHTCFDNPDHYEARAEQAMKICSKAKFIDDQQTRSIPGPRNFKRAQCFTEFVSLFSGTQRTGLLACVCKQKDVEVVSGRAQFSSSSAPGGEDAKEIETLEDCSRSARQQLQDVCLKSPQDFQILALHILQACCKRARVGSSAKFQCAAFVPKDLDSLKPKDLK